MREFVASVMVILGLGLVSTAAGGERGASSEGPQHAADYERSLPDAVYRPGLKRSLSGVDQTYRHSPDERARLSVEERAVISRELRQVLENVYEADRSGSGQRGR